MKRAITKLCALVLAFCMCFGAFTSSASAASVAVTSLSTPSITATVEACDRSGYAGQVTVRWTKVSNATGYEIEFCRYSNASKTTLLASSTTKLDSACAAMGFAYKSNLIGQVCTYRVRAYQTTSSGTIYSAWSSMKTVKNVAVN